MIPPVPYKGDETYIFISYSHRDSKKVWPIIQHMQDSGYRVWYDEGIDPGTEWDENIAAHVTGCSYFIAFISENYLNSDNCRDELNFSRDLGKNQLLVYLEKVQLPRGMDLRFGRCQSVFINGKGNFLTRLYEAEGIAQLRNEGAEYAPIRKKRNIIPVLAAVIAVLAAAVLLISFLGREEQKLEEPISEAEDTVEDTVEEHPETVTEEQIQFMQSTFINEGGFKLTAQSLYIDEEGSLVLEVQAENSNDTEVKFSLEACYINGIKCSADQFDVAPIGDSAAFLSWEAEELEFQGIGDITAETVTVIEGSMRIDGISEPVHFVYYPYGERNVTMFTYIADENDVTVIDNDDFLLVFTDSYYDENGNWVAEFVSENRSDRRTDATVALRQTNGYNYGFHWTEEMRPHCTLRRRVLLPDWQYTEYDAVYKVDGFTALQDPVTCDMFGEYEFTLYPAGDETVEILPRTIKESDVILLDNEDVLIALIGAEPLNEYTGIFRLYCYNKTDHRIHVELLNMTYDGVNEGDWGFAYLTSGNQAFENFYYSHERGDDGVTVTFEIVVYDDDDNSFEMCRKNARLYIEFK